MTTVLNGTSVTYNRGGTTIDTLTAQGIHSTGSTANIVRNSSRTVVVLVTDSSNQACNLPSGCEVGDMVDVFVNPGPVAPNNGAVFPPSGEGFIWNAAPQISFTFAAFFRKLSATEWGFMAS